MEIGKVLSKFDISFFIDILLISKLNLFKERMLLYLITRIILNILEVLMMIFYRMVKVF